MQCKPGSKQGQAEDVFHGLAGWMLDISKEGESPSSRGNRFPSLTTTVCGITCISSPVHCFLFHPFL